VRRHLAPATGDWVLGLHLNWPARVDRSRLEVRAGGGRECYDPLFCGDWKGDAPKQTSNLASVRESSENTFACQTPCLGGGKLLEPGKERRDAVQRQWA
jgi:hypothetical protein